MANTTAAGSVKIMTDTAGTDDCTIAAGGANMMTGTARTDNGSVAAGGANKMTNTAGTDDGTMAAATKTLNIQDIMKDYGLVEGISPTEANISSYACSSHNTGTDIVNEDGCLNNEALRAADLERIDRASTRIKQGAVAARLLNPRHNLDKYDISDSMKGNLRRMNITNLTPLQEHFVENFVGGMTRVVMLTDIVCVAETGAGQTLAYALPLVEYMRGRPQIRKMPLRRQMAEPLGIIVAPTRELVVEIHATFLDLCWTENIRCVAVYGGAPVEEQLHKLSGGCDILVATPGRLLDFLQNCTRTRVSRGRQFLSLGLLHFMVYDEADALLSLSNEKESSFQEEIDAIEGMLPKDRDEDLLINHWFFSSQYSPEEYKRAKSLIHSFGGKGHHYVDFDMPDEEDSQRYIHVEQGFITCDESSDLTKQRLEYMRETFFPNCDLNTGKCLILAHTIDAVNLIEYYINAKFDLRCEKLHGMMTQAHREQAMSSFKHGQVSILVATMKLFDRGVNVDGIRDLVFWELPDTLDQYKYCLDRGGRLGNDAKSTAFITKAGGDMDRGAIMDLRMKAFLEKNGQVVPQAMIGFSGTQPQPSNSYQSASVPEQGSHEAAQVLRNAGQQEMPGVDEQMDSYQSIFGPME